MKSYAAAFILATLVGACLTPPVRALAFRLGAVATPGGRHVHKTTIPRLGGLAIFLAFFAPLVALFFLESSVARVARGEATRVAGLAVGGALLCGVGVLDDTRGVRASRKLLCQIVGATIAFAAGFRIDAVSLPFVGALPMGVWALPITVLWVVGIVNAVNLIDGLDGLAAGVVFFAGLTNFVVAYVSGSIFVAVTMAALLGAVLGFLFYNFNPARIFMGDSGSYFLGYVLAVMSLVGMEQKTSTAVSLLVPVVALGVPIFDTLFAMVRRILERRSIFSPDRGHLHHRLLDMGITHRRAVLIIYGISVVFTVSAVAISLGKSWQVGVAMLVPCAAVLSLIRFLGYFQRAQARNRQVERVRTHDVELLRRGLASLPRRLESAESAASVLSALEGFAEEAELGALEVTDHGGATLLVWESPAVSAPKSNRVERLVARYPLGAPGPGRGEVVFAWVGVDGEISPQAEILLQLVVDFTAARLRAVGGALPVVEAAPGFSTATEVVGRLTPATIALRGP